MTRSKRDGSATDRRPLWLAVSVAAAAMVVGVLGTARATTFLEAPDDALFDQATQVAEIAVLKSLPAPVGGPPATDYFVVVGRVLKGSIRSADIVLRLPGGVADDGLELRLLGVPTFRDGEEAVVFLRENRDGTFAVLHWALGSFRRVAVGGQSFAFRDLEGGELLEGPTAGAGRARDYEAFVRWLGDRGRGVRRAPDYFVDAADDVLRAAFNLFRLRGKNFRWVEFDGGGQVPWRIRGAGSVGTSGVFRPALEAWNRENRTPIRLVLAGGTGSTAGLTRTDGVNALIFGDPNRLMPGKFQCDRGGVIATGGIWFGRQTSRFRGRDHFRILEGDIVINDGAECLFRGRPKTAAEVFVHELGHTLGIGHSCGDSASGPCNNALENDATMRATIHDDGRSASIRTDDTLAARALYEGSGGGGSPDPTPPPEPAPSPKVDLQQPTDLVADAFAKNKVQLGWTDNSTGEGAYEVWIKVGKDDWELNATLPPDSSGLKVKDLTPGTQYKFRVRARAGAKTSDYSESVKAVTPGGGPPNAPSNLTATATSSTTVDLGWRDNSNNEKRFNVQYREGDGGWRTLVNPGPNTTSAEFSDATPGATYDFRVRARRTNKVSDFSNVATVTMPQ